MSPRDRDAELLGASPRRPSVSAIPRPARTASTRRASKSCLATANGMLSPDRARRPPQRRSAGVKSEHAPSSYHLPRNLLPRSESFLTQFEDFNSIEDVLDGATKGLPKSQTTPALLSPNKDITSHRLMRSLDPPLPRSSTYDGFLSPERRTRPQEPTRQLCFNNTMTPRRNEKPRASSKSPYPFRDRVTVGVDGEDGNTSWSLPDNDSALSSVTGSEKSEVLVDPRHVFIPQPAIYWLGRYTTLVDRLRTNELIPRPESASSNRDGRNLSLKHKTSMEFERAERDIKKEAMATLRSFCQTDAATSSLDKFAIYMSQNDPSFSRHPAVARHERNSRPYPTVVKQQSGQYPPVNPAKPRVRKLSDNLPHIPPNIFRKAPNPNRREPTISKSFTIGNFGSTGSFSSPGPSYPSNGHLATGHDGRKVSYYSHMSETRLRAVEERDARPSASKTMPGQSSDRKASHVEDVFRPTNKVARMPLSQSVASIKLNSETPPQTSFKMVKHEVAAVDGGASQTQEDNSTIKHTRDVDVEDTPTGHSRRFRKSESMKKLFGASIKEIRKMGHRVSNTGGHDGADEY